MKTCLITAIAVSVSCAAFAKDLKGKVMTEADMDRVVAGTSVYVDPGKVVPIDAPSGVVAAQPHPIFGGQPVGGSPSSFTSPRGVVSFQ
jgi:hypothetical protein